MTRTNFLGIAMTVVRVFAFVASLALSISRLYFQPNAASAAEDEQRRHADDEARRKEDEIRSKVEIRQKQMLADSYLSSGIEEARRLLQFGNEVQACDATLSLMHHARFHAGDPADLMRSAEWLAKMKCDQMAAREQLEMLSKSFQELRPWCRLGDLGTSYELVMERPWPLAWRTNKQEFLELATKIIQSVNAEHPAAVWKEKSRTDETNADKYLFVYLRILRARRIPVEHIDFSVIQPFVERSGRSLGEAVRWQAIILNAYISAGLAANDEKRIELRKRLLSTICAGQFENRNRSCIDPLAQLYKIADPMSEAQPLLDGLLHQNSGM